MKKLINTDNFSLPVSFAVLIIIWESLVYILKTPDYLIPAPSMVVKALVDSFPILMRHTAVTLLEVILGFAAALILSVAVSLLMVRFRTLYKILWPYMIISQTIPLYILAPLFMIWFGFGILPKVLIVGLVCFFPITVAFVQGLTSTEPELDELLQVMRATPSQIMWKIRVPQAMPQFFSGLKIAAAYSVTGAVLSEWVGAQEGLGIFLTRSMKTFKTAALFADVMIIIVLSLAIFYAISFIEKKVIRRRIPL
ncbi:ABC transporter permease protein [Thermoclostridium stercorarium subsp. stercorarium DSM 8532]|jgi:putative hydroxymethylpyrimidine transport system permease protein|uniref:ABC transporter permease protein n=3 Tax=Thermoclostridium stercorarium TaxID=1510 RepID=L7VQK4_THES1|nr:ABC transporter permease [Thermoclostridium stercorarium]AGC67853.1 ABC transporter permease protein [Thermoclostridium stercorarium subsp. stercorarium DSM 8532]AGI38894.1 ABC transporter permease subunit [Thermoclostridium stercorarium subsp. stercorarium DSM 8532]ANW98265.1 ABC transporter permease [Thermoclostridium stercorarium subsp. thermolacticum DSM 2910]ANX00789.1 ABC transporter permease [Thermoclostridium stercorarium subsp. leptospartum DSM 9219]UZQ86403.1 ABC transporter perme